MGIKWVCHIKPPRACVMCALSARVRAANVGELLPLPLDGGEKSVLGGSSEPTFSLKVGAVKKSAGANPNICFCLCPSPRACTAKVSKIYWIVLDCLSRFPLSFSGAEKVALKNYNALLARENTPTRRFHGGGGLLHLSRAHEQGVLGALWAILKNPTEKTETVPSLRPVFSIFFLGS